MNSQKLSVPEDWNIQEIEQNGCHGYQFWTHKSIGEGFFISILKASNNSSEQIMPYYKKHLKSVPFPFLPSISLNDLVVQQYDNKYFAYTNTEIQAISKLKAHGNIIKKGIYLGEIKGKELIPSYDLAMNSRSCSFSNQLDLNLEEALQYLKGNSLNLKTPKGVILLTHKQLPLGFGKSNELRINNLLPKHLRIN